MGRMKRTVLIALGLMLAAANAQAAPAHAKWMGEATCAAWPSSQSYNEADKALLLNWVLGWLSRSGKDGADVLARVDQPSVSRWVDRYCAANPTDTLISAAARLETELAGSASVSRL
jgi:hypothetical protein